MPDAVTTYDPLPRFVVSPGGAVKCFVSTEGGGPHVVPVKVSRLDTDPLLRGGQGNAAPAFGSAGFACALWCILGVLLGLGAGLGLHAAF